MSCRVREGGLTGLIGRLQTLGVRFWGWQIPVMPFYRFRIHGQGTSGAGVAGFYTTRRAFAGSKEKAAAKALEAVRRDWTTGASSSLSPDGPPASLTIEEGWEIGLHEIWSAPNKGNSLYAKAD